VRRRRRSLPAIPRDGNPQGTSSGDQDVEPDLPDPALRLGAISGLVSDDVRDVGANEYLLATIGDRCPARAIALHHSRQKSLVGELVSHLHYGETRLDNNLVECDPAILLRQEELAVYRTPRRRAARCDPLLRYRLPRTPSERPLGVPEGDILTRLPRMPNQDYLSALTPENWQPAL
jgi:hypothetical protein